LRVRRRVKNRNGEQVFCELPNDTICALPTWMFSSRLHAVHPRRSADSNRGPPWAPRGASCLANYIFLR